MTPLVNTLHWDKETLHLYSMRNIYVQDEINRVTYGYKKGLVEGETKGELKNQHITARRMLAKGMSLEIVSECTGLSSDEVKALLEKI